MCFLLLLLCSVAESSIQFFVHIYKYSLRDVSLTTVRILFRVLCAYDFRYRNRRDIYPQGFKTRPTLLVCQRKHCCIDVIVSLLQIRNLYKDRLIIHLRFIWYIFFKPESNNKKQGRND
jgi:hypothetical protein